MRLYPGAAGKLRGELWGELWREPWGQTKSGLSKVLSRPPKSPVLIVELAIL